VDQSERAEIVISGGGDDPILEVDGLAVDVPAGRDPMLVGIELVATTATRREQAVPATVVADEGNWQWRLLVHPDGTTSDDTDDGGRRARRRPSRLAVAAIGAAVLAGGGITALAVTTNSDQAPGIAAGSVGGSPATVATAAPDSGSPTRSPTPLAPPAATPQAPTPQPVAPAGVPKPVPAPAPVVARTARPTVAPQAPRRTTSAVVAPRPAAAPTGRLVAISDGAGNCATASGSAVSTGSCTGGAAQKWTATAAGELRQGSRCLVTRSGIAVVDCASVPAPARTWTPTSPSPGLVNPATSLCLGTTGSTVVAAQCGTGRSLRIA
jgi:hypothetical protein